MALSTTKMTTAMTQVVTCQGINQTSSSLKSSLVRSQQKRWHNGHAAATIDSVEETTALPMRHNPQSTTLRTACRNWNRRMGLAEMDVARVYLQQTTLSRADWNDAYAVWQSLVRVGHPPASTTVVHYSNRNQESPPPPPPLSFSTTTLSVALQLFAHLVRQFPSSHPYTAMDPHLIEGMVCQWKRAALRNGSSGRTSSAGTATAIGPWPSAVDMARVVVLSALQTKLVPLPHATQHSPLACCYTEATVHMILDVAIRQATPSLAPIVAQQLWTDLTVSSSMSSSISSLPDTVSPSASSSLLDSFWYDRPIEATTSGIYQPNGFTYNLFLWAWAESGTPQAEENMLRLAAHRRQFQNSTTGNLDDDHDRMWNHVWLRFYRVQGRLDQITALWSQIQASRRIENAPLDSTSCLEVVYAYTNAGDVATALPVLQSMVRTLVARARSSRHQPPPTHQAVSDTVKGLFHVLKAYATLNTRHATSSNRIGPDLRNAKPRPARTSAANGMHCLNELVDLLDSHDLVDAFSRGK
jgi:hypothetical protein